MLTVTAQGSPAETIVYGIDLRPDDVGVFTIDPERGDITVGPNGTDRLVIRVHCNFQNTECANISRAAKYIV